MKNILIISRDTIFAKATQIILENNGFGVDSLPVLPADLSHYDAVISDMPSINPDNFLCPMIITSYEKIDCKYFLPRPFSDKELLDMCDSACICDTPHNEVTLILDTKRKLVKFGKRTANLTEREFELLSLLMSIPHRVITREEIIDNVFGGTATGNADAVYVNYLRKKLISLCSKNPIINVRGVGYEFKY